MVTKNFTPVDDELKKKQNGQYVSKPKESEPTLGAPEDYDVKEVVEHEVTDEEIKSHVTIHPETIELPPDLKKLGVQSTQTTSFPTFQNVKTPLADDKVLTGLHAPITSSLRWLATFAWYLLQKAHVTLRLVHGKVMRVFKS